MSAEIPVLTLDGPSGSGKGTVAQAVATKLGWHYLDSGALYRVLAWLANEQGVDLEDASALVILASGMDLQFDHATVLLDDREIGDEIRTETVAALASRVAPLAEVRDALMEWQRARARPPGLVADGRDMGTVVFPRARCKVFLTASVEARAERRFNQLREKGFDVNIRRLFSEIKERDQRDAGRKVSPLRPAADAFELDTTDLSIEEVVSRVLIRVAAAYPLPQ